MGPKLSDQRHTHTVADVISRLGYDPSVNQTAESYFTTKVNRNSKSSQRQNWTAVSNTMVQTKSRHQRHKDCNILCTNHGKKDGIYPLRTKKYPLKSGSKSTEQRSIIKIYCKNMQKHQKGFAFSAYWGHNSAILKMKLNHPSISTGQSNQLVPLLLSAP